jgi:hypothetical protein
MIMHGLTNFKFTIDEFVRAVVLKIMMPVCDARAIFVEFMVKIVKLGYIYVGHFKSSAHCTFTL